MEHAACRLFVQLGTEEVSGANQQIPVQDTQPPKIDSLNSRVGLIYAQRLTFVVLWCWNAAQGRPASLFSTGGLNLLIPLEQSPTMDRATMCLCKVVWEALMQRIVSDFLTHLTH